MPSQLATHTRIAITILTVIESFLLLCVLLFVKREGKEKDRWPTGRFILGHRGARRIRPENTLSAFLRAVHDVDGIELDVHLSSDGIPMVIHDETLERTTGSKGYVGDKTAKELAALNAAHGWKNLPKEGVPTLERVLSAMPENSIVNVELKSSAFFDDTVYVDAVLLVLRLYEKRLRIIISSFDSALLFRLKKKNSPFAVGMLYALDDRYFFKSLWDLPKLRPEALHIRPSIFSAWIVWLSHKKGLHVAFWTVNSPQKAQALFEEGAACVMTDDVDDVNKKRLYSL